MGTIQTGVGIFSGIDSANLIEQLLLANAGPRRIAETRLFELQSQQAAYLDINSRLSALQSAASAFRTNKIFDSKNATSSEDTVLAASASSAAQNGTYQFIVDRLVTSQQLLTRGFTDTDQSSVGLSNLTVESFKARLDRDTALADLNNGEGITRGTIVITDDATGNTTEIDLSKVGTVQDVLDAVNSSGAPVTASVNNSGFVFTHNDGTGFSIESGAGYTTAETLGIETGSVTGTFTGSAVFGINLNTSISALNDGRGVSGNDLIGEYSPTTGTIRDFTITVDGTSYNVTLGEIFENQVDDDGNDVFAKIEGFAATVGDVVDRINLALADEADVSAEIDQTTGGIRIVNGAGQSIEIADADDTTTATELGLVTSAATTSDVQGSRLVAGLNTTLLSSINGGTGLGGNTSLTITPGDGSGDVVVDLSSAETLNDVVSLINAAGAGKFTAGLNDIGTGLRLTDISGGVSDLTVSGDAAAALGFSGSATDNVLDGADLDLAWIGLGTTLDSLNAGKGVGTGSFRITDSFGNTTEIRVDGADRTLFDVIDEINGSSVAVTARINDTGDGIIIEEDLTDPDNPGGPALAPGSVAISIEDVDGSVARELGIAGEASDTGASNFIDGSYETTIEFESGDTLDDVVRKINEAGVEFTAAILNDGAGSNPFRLSLSARDTGSAGRFILDTGGFDLGVTTLDEGGDARVFFGSTDPARGILVSSSSDTLDGVLQGVTIDLKATSSDPVELSVTTDNETIEAQVEAFVAAFNELVGRIDEQTRYIEETDTRGALLGDGTVLSLRQALFNQTREDNLGFAEGINNLASVGITVGTDSQLTFDAETFREAIENDPDAVEKLFTQRVIDPDGNTIDLGDGASARDPNAATAFSELGVIAQFEQFAARYINSIDGVLTERGRSLDTQIALQEDRIEAINGQLDNQREILQRQFLSMERAIASLQTQQAALGQLG